ncbi:hypothetical protein [Tortoise microvirus 47]|nr:hypothetical protein [Tortoise microvirus 47]
MTIRLNSLDRWKVLERGQAIMFDRTSSQTERRIRLHLNLAGQTTFYVENEEGPRFLAVAGPGLETIEFSAAGKFAVMADDAAGEVQYQTAEGEPTFAVVVDPVIFTRIANRRHRNPELEEIMYRMQTNMERRLAQQAGEMEAALARRLQEVENGRPAETVKTDAPGANPKPVSQPAPEAQPVEQQSGEGSGSAGSGEPPSDGGAGAVS